MNSSEFSFTIKLNLFESSNPIKSVAELNLFKSLSGYLSLEL